MGLHGLLAVAVLAASVTAGALPAKRLEVPPPNPMPKITESIFDFLITDFEAKAVVLSDRNYVSFFINPYPDAEDSHCFAMGTTFTHSLTTIPQTWCYPRHNHTDDGDDDDDDDDHDHKHKPNSQKEHDHIWFSWTMGTDVDPLNPTADSVFGMDKTTGAYLKIVRQVDAHTRDEAVHHVGDWHLPMVGEGMLRHMEYTGLRNFSLASLRFDDVAH